jgi:hypothetical protein
MLLEGRRVRFVRDFNGSGPKIPSGTSAKLLRLDTDHCVVQVLKGVERTLMVPRSAVIAE